MYKQYDEDVCVHEAGSGSKAAAYVSRMMMAITEFVGKAVGEEVMYELIPIEGAVYYDVHRVVGEVE